MFFKRIEKSLFYLLLFFLPSQLAYHFWPDYAFIFGVRVDYLAPTIYLTDVIVLLLLVISRTRIKTLYLIVILILAAANILISVSPWVSLWKWVKIFELIFLAKYIYDNRELIKDKVSIKIISLSLLLVSVLGITQVILGRTLGGIFYLIGERSFNLNTPGIALQAIAGVDTLRVYSSFSHPNSLAGYLLIGILFLISLRSKDILIKTALIISFICFLLTFSLSATLAIIVTAIFYLIYKKNIYLFKKLLTLTLFLTVFLSFSLPFIKINSDYPREVKERLEQSRIATSLVREDPILGKGLNTFPIFNRALQPVHNIFLLTVSETGITGLIILIAIIYFSLRKKMSLFLIPILILGFFDHYLLTLQQNILVTAILFGTIFAEEKKIESKDGKSNNNIFRRRIKR